MKIFRYTNTLGKKLNSQHSPILLTIAFSLALNLHGLAADSFWGDEILTASFASQSPGDIIRWTATDIHPPLYYLLAGVFTRLTVTLGLNASPAQVSDWLWRYPSVLTGVLAVGVTYSLAVRLMRLVAPLHKRQIATTAAILLCVAPVAIKYGQEARMHALFMLLAALSTLLFFRAMALPKHWGRWLVYSLAATASIYTMYFGFLILAAHASYVLCSAIYNKRIAQSIIGYGGAMVLAGLLYGPWWLILLGIVKKRQAVGAIEGGVGSPADFVLGVVEALGPFPVAVAWLFLLLFTVSLALLSQRFWPLAGFSLVWLALPVLLPIVLGDPRALQFRYAFILPIYLTVVAYTTVQLGLFLGDTMSGKKVSIQKANQTNQQPAILYVAWIVTALAFVATLGSYNQTKPNWRAAAAYLNEHTAPADIILIGPLWDEGRFIDYYYRGQAQLLTPAAMVTNIGGRSEGLRSGGGRIWAVNRYPPNESGNFKNIEFTGVTISEPQVTVYEPQLLAGAALDLASQAVDAAYPWARQAEAQGVLDPDPRTARAAALRAYGDTLVAANRPQEAIEPYQIAVDIFPGWTGGFVALAEAQVLVGNAPAAVKAYQQAVIYNPHWQGPLADEASVLLEAQQWEKALELYQQIVDGG